MGQQQLRTESKRGKLVIKKEMMLAPLKPWTIDLDPPTEDPNLRMSLYCFDLAFDMCLYVL